MNQNSFKIKLKEVFFPSVALFLVFFAVYTLVRYEVNIRQGIQYVPVEVWNFVLPLGLSLFVAYRWMRKPLLRLRYTDKQQAGIKLFTGFVAGMALWFLQLQLVADSRTFQVVETVADLKYPPAYACFRVKDFQWDTARYGTAYHSYSKSEGRGSSRLVAEKFCVIPLMDSAHPADSSVYWLALKYRVKGEKNRSSATYRKYLFEWVDFQAKQEYEGNKYRQYGYLEVLPHSSDYSNYQLALKRVGGYADKVVLLSPVYQPYHSAGSRYLWLAAGLFTGLCVVLLALVMIKDYE